MNTELFFVINLRKYCLWGGHGFHGGGDEGLGPCRMLHRVSVCIVTDVLVGPSALILSVVIYGSMWLNMRKTQRFLFCGNCKVKRISVTRENREGSDFCSVFSLRSVCILACLWLTNWIFIL